MTSIDLDTAIVSFGSAAFTVARTPFVERSISCGFPDLKAVFVIGHQG